MVDWNGEMYERELQLLKQNVERDKWRKRYREEMDQDTFRAQRAQRTANMIMALVREFIPEKCVRDAFEEIALNAFASNIELIEVPPECDHLQKLQLEKRMLEKMVEPITISKTK